MNTRTLTCAFAVLALNLPAAAGAAEWYLTPQVSLRAGYNSNLEITTQPHKGVEELDLIPEAAFGRKTRTAGITGNVRFDGRRFWGQSGLNTNDRLLNLHLYDNGQRMMWTLDGNITRDTTLQSELSATGLVLGRTARLSRSLKPSWTYMINERTRFNLGYQHQDVRYPDQISQVYSDYQINAGTASISYQYTPRLQLFTSGSVTYYRTTKNLLPYNGQNFKARYDSLLAGASYAFSQRLNASLSAGVTRSTTSVTVCEAYFVGVNLCNVGLTPYTKQSTTSSGSALNASVQRRFETGTLGATLTRNIQPTGYGGLVETDHLRFSGAHSLSAKFSESLKLDLYRTTAVNSAANDRLNRTFVRLEPAFTWHMTRWWQLQASYRYERQRYQVQSDTATQNAVYCTLSYTWPRIAVSR